MLNAFHHFTQAIWLLEQTILTYTFGVTLLKTFKLQITIVGDNVWEKIPLEKLFFWYEASPLKKLLSWKACSKSYKWIYEE